MSKNIVLAVVGIVVAAVLASFVLAGSGLPLTGQFHTAGPTTITDAEFEGHSMIELPEGVCVVHTEEVIGDGDEIEFDLQIQEHSSNAIAKPPVGKIQSVWLCSEQFDSPGDSIEWNGMITVGGLTAQVSLPLAIIGARDGCVELVSSSNSNGFPIKFEQFGGLSLGQQGFRTSSIFLLSEGTFIHGINVCNDCEVGNSGLGTSNFGSGEDFILHAIVVVESPEGNRCSVQWEEPQTFN